MGSITQTFSDHSRRSGEDQKAMPAALGKVRSSPDFPNLQHMYIVSKVRTRPDSSHHYMPRQGSSPNHCPIANTTAFVQIWETQQKEMAMDRDGRSPVDDGVTQSEGPCCDSAATGACRRCKKSTDARRMEATIASLDLLVERLGSASALYRWQLQKFASNTGRSAEAVVAEHGYSGTIGCQQFVGPGQPASGAEQKCETSKVDVGATMGGHSVGASVQQDSTESQTPDKAVLVDTEELLTAARLQDKEETTMMPCYADDIHENLIKAQLTITPSFLLRQKDVTSIHRSMVVHWLIELSYKQMLRSECIYHAVQIFDRVLQMSLVPRYRLQLVGATSLLLASKFEDHYFVPMGELVDLSDGDFSKKQLVRMEREVLRTLKWKLAMPTTIQFFRRWGKMIGHDFRQHTLTKFITETALVDSAVACWQPSLQAAAAVYLARRMTVDERNVSAWWTSTLENCTGYTESQILPCARNINDVLRRECSKKERSAVQLMYSSSRFQRVACIPLAWLPLEVPNSMATSLVTVSKAPLSRETLVRINISNGLNSRLD